MHVVKNLKKSFAVLSACAILNACAHVKINDAEWCADLGADGASCFHTLTDESRDLTREQWDQARFGQVCTSSDSFANWKAAILKFCSRTRLCTYQFKKSVEDFSERVQEAMPE
jgi:hypothetical protein